MIIVGADPGLTGGIVAIRDGIEITSMEVMPRLGDAIGVRSIGRMLSELAPDHVFIEQVHSMPRQGVSSSFKFGRVYGQLEGVVGALGLTYTLVTPQRWQKLMHAGCSHENPKERSAMAVARLFPRVDFTIGRAQKPHSGLVDAALIALYGWRTLKMVNL